MLTTDFRTVPPVHRLPEASAAEQAAYNCIARNQCIAAAVIFHGACLGKILEAEQSAEHSPERACRLRKAQLYSDLGGEMTKLAAEFVTEGRR